MLLSAVERLRADLSAVSYTVGTVEQLWGQRAAAALFRGQRIPAQRALDARRGPDGDLDPVGALATLFVLGLPITRRELAAALPTTGVDGAAALELIDVGSAGGYVLPLLDLRPYSFTDGRGSCSWWIASDRGELALGHAIPESHVLGIGGASTTLSGLMIGEPVSTALDLGTGCGVQALHASRHAGHVVATDISARAIALARFNAALNGVTNIEFRLGDLFEPVAGERFDQIVSNPPFVITPRVEGVPAYEYRDGGMVGDALISAVIRGAAEHLSPGGIAQLLGNWEYRRGASGLDRVGGWLDRLVASGRGVDAWVVERDVQDADAYAETWIRDGGTRPGTAEFDAMYAAWLDDFTARRVESVGFGYLTLRRPAEGSDVRFRRLETVETHGANGAGMGAHIAACLGAADWLAGHDDEGLATSRLRVAPDVTEERHYWPGAEDPTVITLRQGSGFGRSIAVDTGLAAVVGACDGELSVGAICGAVAQLLDVDEGALRDELFPRVRELIWVGFLLTGQEAAVA